MIGNDIVALDCAGRHRVTDARWYKKVLNDAEQVCFHMQDAGLSPDLFIWLLWSIKESAYKCKKKSSPGLLFSPSHIRVTDIRFPQTYFSPELSASEWVGTGFPAHNTISSSVCYGSTILFARSIIHPLYIASVVHTNDNFETILQGIRMIQNSDHKEQSREVRSFAGERLRSMPVPHFCIEKSPEGYPLICQDDKKTNIQLSFSHHGRFVFYSILMPPGAAPQPQGELPVNSCSVPLY